MRTWWGVVPILLHPGLSLEWNRRAATTMRFTGPVPRAGRILPFLTIAGRPLEIESRRLVVGPESDTSIDADVGVLPIRIGGSILIAWRAQPGEVPRRGDWITMTDPPSFRFDGVLQDWSYDVDDALPMARWSIMDWTWALLDVVQDTSVVAGSADVGTAVSNLADIVGLTVKGVVPDNTESLALDFNVGVTWLSVLRQIIGSRSWRVSGRALDFTSVSEVWRGDRFEAISIRPLRDGRALTLGINNDGMVVGVVGAGRPQATATVETMDELRRVHAANGRDALTVTASSHLPEVLPQPGATVTVVVPGRGARHRCVVQSVRRTIGSGDERETSVEAVSEGAIEDPVYG